MQKYLIAIIILLFTTLLAILIWGGVTNWKFITEESGKSGLTPRFPSELTAINECKPSRGCNVCDACCKDYIPDGQPCDDCVAGKCNPCKPDSTGKCGANVCSYCCNTFIGQEGCAGCISSVCQACKKNGVMGSDGKCVCNQEYPDCINHNGDKADCLLSSDNFGNKVCQYNSDNTCTSKTTWMGSTCQYSRELNCNSHGNVDNNGACTCDAGYAGESCEYSRAINCNNHGNPSGSDTVACTCDLGWNDSTCMGVDKVSDQEFTNPGIGYTTGTCEDILICPWVGVTLSDVSMTYGNYDGIENIVNWKNCIHVADQFGRGPDFTFTATGANGKTESYHVQKDCCGFQAFACMRSTTQPLNISGGSNYKEWSADDITPGGIIIGMPL
jgi:hypothetical protein